MQMFSEISVNLHLHLSSAAGFYSLTGNDLMTAAGLQRCVIGNITFANRSVWCCFPSAVSPPPTSSSFLFAKQIRRCTAKPLCLLGFL